jgi:UDP-N-acetylmuramate--alanine ligase
MRALAELLADLGWTLTGSDQSELETPLHIVGRQLRFHLGHAASHVAPETDVLIFSPAVTESNPERATARQLGIPQRSYSQFLGELMRQRTGIAVAGTHGKTTTTAMLATLLRECGLSPSAAIGGEVVQYNRSGWGGDGPFFVAESCEYRCHFLDHSPKFATILGIEPDHFDCFPNWESQLEAFREFAARVPPDGVLVIPAESEGAATAVLSSEAGIETTRVECVPFPHRDEGPRIANWLARDVRKTQNGFRFQVDHNGTPFCETALAVPGRHNLENALTAIALAHAAGAAAESIAKALPKFEGVRRRFEVLRSVGGGVIIDDYAHHPTAIRATLKTAREQFGARRLLVAFQPHQISRTRELMRDFAGSFAEADELFLVPIFAARESSDRGSVTLAELAGRVSDSGVSVRRLASLDRLKPTLDHAARPDDVVLILGAGNISRIAHELSAGRIPGHHTG